MNNKNVYSLNNTFEGKIWVDWKGKDGKIGQEISCHEIPNISTLRKSPRIGTCGRVRHRLWGTCNNRTIVPHKEIQWHNGTPQEKF